jgi:hypothetical protein
LTATYPNAITNDELVSKVTGVLSTHGYTESNTLLATSLCCDEVNRVLEKDLGKVYGDNFSMGGLAGFPFCGTVSFGAMAHHIPDDGSCLIVYGPHVGFDETGAVGKLTRRGLHHSGSCCGSACAALAYVQKISQGLADEAPLPTEDPIEMQQWLVGKLLLNHATRLEQTENPLAELPMALFDEQSKLIHDIVKKGCNHVANGTIALLGGVQINTPSGTSDFFLPLKFELFNNQGELMKDLLWE